jgi:flagellar export protein FliJ
MGFKFSLEGLLRVRKSFEKQEEHRLAAAVGELKRLNMMLESVREQLISTADRLGKLLAQGTTGADLHLLCLEKFLLERRERALAESVSSALAKMEAQQARLQEARKKRKVLDKLRQKQMILCLLIEGRREQQTLDDAFLMRRSNDDSGKGVA